MTPYDEIRAERARQDERWGEQNHPLGTGAGAFRANADAARRECDAAAASGTVTWRHIVLEELWEALAEADEAAARRELVQLGAVVVAMIECIDRRSKETP
jgi:hypothetical protein